MSENTDAPAEPLLTTAAVARLLNVTPARVRQLDDELQPTRTESGQRLYAREHVEAYRNARRTQKAAGGDPGASERKESA